MMMKGSSSFLERICKRVRRRRTKTRSKSSKKCPEASESKSSKQKTQRVLVQSNSVAVVLQSAEAAGTMMTGRLCHGVSCFQDSTAQQQQTCSTTARTSLGSSLPARTRSQDTNNNIITSSAPQLHVTKAEPSNSEYLEQPEEKEPATTQAVVGGAVQEEKRGGASASSTAAAQFYMLSATDSGLYSEEEEGSSEDEFLEVFSDDDDDGEEDEDDDDDETIVGDGWLIPAQEVALDKVLVSNSCETVYNGYWHGSVAVHARFSSSSEMYHSILSDVSTLRNIRHENIQLFLGVCRDLHSDYISIVMDQMKGQTLHHLVHRDSQQFKFQNLTKIVTQVAQGMEYLHAKGIPHPLLTSQSVTLHYRVCISMLNPGSASMGVVNASDLPYLSPEVMRTVSQHSNSEQTGLTCPSSPHSLRGLQSRSNSTSSRQLYRIPSGAGWSSPGSPSLKSAYHKQQQQQQFDNTGLLLSPDSPLCSSRRASCDDVRIDGGSHGCGRQRVQVKGSTAVMQTPQANIFSFGTLLYELLTLEKPFQTTTGNQIIYQVGNGIVHPLNNMRDGRFKQTIKRCWRKEPNARPSFQEILSTFEQNISPRSCGLKKSHFSFSVPNQLNKLGQFENGGLNL